MKLRLHSYARQVLRWQWLLLLGIAFFIWGAKLMLIQQHGSELPFGDQWEGEGLELYRPWLLGQLGWKDFFAAHNEHRILFTRLIDLAVLVANGQWDSRLLLVVNTGIPLLSALLLVREGVRCFSPFEASLFALATALLVSSNVSYGNTLWAFQSQFYLSILFSLLHVGLTFLAAPFRWRWWLGQVIGLGNLFTNAGGVLSPAAVALVIAWRKCVRRERRPGDWFVLTWNVAVVGFGFCILVHVPGHDVLRPATALEIARAVAAFFSWPFSDSRMWLLNYAPAIIWCLRFAFARQVNGKGDALTALIVLSALQNVVFAVFRGAVWSRYLDNVGLGLLINLGCILAWPGRDRWTLVKPAVLAAWLCLVVNALFVQERFIDERALPDNANRIRSDHTVIRRIIRGELHNLSGSAAGMGLLDIQKVITDPQIRTILPPTMRTPLPLSVQNGGGFSPFHASAEEFPSSPWPGFDAFRAIGSIGRPGSWSSGLVTAASGWVTFLVSGSIEEPGNSLLLRTQSGKIIHAEQKAVSSHGSWVQMNFRAPREPFYVVAHVETSNGFSFSEPVETPTITWLVGKIIKVADVFWWLGIASLVVALLLVLVRRWTQRERPDLANAPEWETTRVYLR